MTRRSPTPGREAARPTFAVRFVCGAVLGIGLGFGAWVHSLPDAAPPVVFAIVAGTSVVCGLLAAFLGDRFWTEWLRMLR